MKFSGKIFFLLLICILGLNAFADEQHVYQDRYKVKELQRGWWILKDAADTLSPTEAAKSNNYILHENAVPNLGISDDAYWIKFDLLNLSQQKQLVLEVYNATIDEVFLYRIKDNKVILIERLGEIFPFRHRTIEHQNYLFNLSPPLDTTITYLMRVKAGEQLLVPMRVGSYLAIYDAHNTLDLISGMYFGLILVMVLYNLFIFFSVRDRSYLFYVIYIFLVGFTQLTLKGYGFKFFWPDLPTVAIYSTYFTGALSGMATLLFIKSFLRTKIVTPVSDKVLNVFFGIYIIALITAVFGVFNVSYTIINFNAFIGTLYVLFLSITLARRGYRSAKFFLVAWSIFLVSIIIFVMKDYGLIPYTIITRYILEIGSAIEIVLLSFALADRINILKKEKEESQLQALEALKENERMILEQNIILEQKVEERTIELQESNQELNSTLNSLKETQAQLVNAEKMASLGQLTAGIAHEINNPINFVASNIKPLKRDISDLKELISKYDELTDGEDLIKKLEEVEELKDELDVQYLFEEIDALLKGIDEGASRTAEIVRGLKNFSRLDEDDLKLADINEGLDSTLTLLRNSTKNTIHIEKDFDEDMEIECYPGKLNQVFMNILTNAIQAINGQKRPEMEGKIILTTKNLGDKVQLSIKDNGPGIPEEAKAKIFDPFFTTKDVGEGTGLGLSIVYSIIESHHGHIEVLSESGVGTEFLITLPKAISNSNRNDQ